MTSPWLFFSELLVIGAIWFFIAEFNYHFSRKESLGRAMHDKVLLDNATRQKSPS